MIGSTNSKNKTYHIRFYPFSGIAPSKVCLFFRCLSSCLDLSAFKYVYDPVSAEGKIVPITEQAVDDEEFCSKCGGFSLVTDTDVIPRIQKQAQKIGMNSARMQFISEVTCTKK